MAALSMHLLTGFRLKLEYLHFDLGSASYNVNLVSGDSSGMPTTWPASAKVSGDIFRVGVNYKLN